MHIKLNIGTYSSIGTEKYIFLRYVVYIKGVIKWLHSKHN